MPTPTGPTMIHVVAADPSDAFHSVISGVQEQAHKVNLATHGIKAGIVPGSGLSRLNLAEHTSWAPAPNAVAIELHAGMRLAQNADNFVVTSVAEKCAWPLMEAMSSASTKTTRLPYARIIDQPVQCDYCHTLVKSGTCWSKFSLTPICC